MLSLSQLKYSKQDHLQRLLLDLSPTEGYKVLHSEQVTLLGKNIIRTMHGPMYFTLTETLGQTSYNLPLGNRQAIEKALGLLS
jgi:hypothetical protein